MSAAADCTQEVKEWPAEDIAHENDIAYKGKPVQVAHYVSVDGFSEANSSVKWRKPSCTLQHAAPRLHPIAERCE